MTLIKLMTVLLVMSVGSSNLAIAYNEGDEITVLKGDTLPPAPRGFEWVITGFPEVLPLRYDYTLRAVSGGSDSQPDQYKEGDEITVLKGKPLPPAPRGFEWVITGFPEVLPLRYDYTLVAKGKRNRADDVTSLKSPKKFAKYWGNTVANTEEWRLQMDMESELASFFDNDTEVTIPLLKVTELPRGPGFTQYVFHGNDTNGSLLRIVYEISKDESVEKSRAWVSYKVDGKMKANFAESVSEDQSINLSKEDVVAMEIEAPESMGTSCSTLFE